mgnify:CR=1 FL=1
MLASHRDLSKRRSNRLRGPSPLAPLTTSYADFPGACGFRSFAAGSAVLEPSDGAATADAGLVHFSRQAPADHGLCHASGLDQELEINARLDTHAVEHVD